MQRGPDSIRYQFNVEAVNTRSYEELKAELEAAERRARAAEESVESLRVALSEVTRDRDAQLVAKQELWTQNRALSNENDVLLSRISTLTKQLAAATESDEQRVLGLELSKLQRQLDQRNKALFGSKSERRRQRRPATDQPPRRPKRSGGKRTEQPSLPIEQVVHRLDPEQLASGCERCHGELAEMNDQTEDSELIHSQPVQYRLVLHRQQKYHCGGCGAIFTAPGPDKLVAGGRYAPDFVVDVAVDKYGDHLPLARQVRRMACEGLDLTTQALWDQLRHLYLLLLPTLLLIREQIVTAPLVHVDESPWRMMSNEGGSKRYWLWVLSDGQASYFQIFSTRGQAAARVLLGDYDGIVMADDYTVYTSLERERSRIGGVQQVIDADGTVIDLPTPDYTLATCWSHARRYLHRAEQYHPEAGVGLDLIEQLYAVEADVQAAVEERAEASGGSVTPEQLREWLHELRRDLRQRRSRDLIDRLDAWRQGLTVLPDSALDEALRHIDKIWPRLVLFLDEPLIPLDNNHAERQIRSPVNGRKNYYGSHSPEGADAAALFFSLISTAKALGLDPRAYLRAATRSAIRQEGTLTPWDYAAGQQNLATEGGTR